MRPFSIIIATFAVCFLVRIDHVASFSSFPKRRLPQQEYKTLFRHDGGKTVMLHSTAETNVNNNNDDTMMDMEQRNLRFAGVGRLYTKSVKNKKMDHKKGVVVDVEPHIEVIQRLSRSTVVVVGLGGVGSWAAEAICRSGVGTLVLIDLDDICISNTNRQLHAMSSSVGKMKIDVMKERIQNINPDCHVQLIHDFVSPDNIHDILKNIPNITACLDAIDGSRSKSALIAACVQNRIPIVTCGGSAGRTDPTKFVHEDLSRAQGDPLLSACRKTLRKSYGFEEGLSFRDAKQKPAKRKWKIPAVFSTEPQKSLPKSDVGGGGGGSSLRRCDGALGTACFVTGTSGFVAAGLVIDMIATGNLVVPRYFAKSDHSSVK